MMFNKGMESQKTGRTEIPEIKTVQDSSFAETSNMKTVSDMENKIMKRDEQLKNVTMNIREPQTFIQ